MLHHTNPFKSAVFHFGLWLHICLLPIPISAKTAPQESPTIVNAVKGIYESARMINENTAPTALQATDTDEYVNLTLSIIAAFGTILTAVAVRLEFRQRAISMEIQRRVLFDLIRHLYRNKVCVCASALKTENYGYDRYYPSEEHLLKLKVLPEDLRFDRFNNTPQYYDILHSLELKFRNYNTEIDVTLEHLKNSGISANIKSRDMSVLSNKSDYLTREIIQLLAITQERLKSSPDMSLLISRLIEYRLNLVSLKGKRQLPDWVRAEHRRNAVRALKRLETLIHQIDNLIEKTSSEYSVETTSRIKSVNIRSRESFFYDRRPEVKKCLDEDIVREYDVISMVPFNGHRSISNRGRRGFR